METQPVAQSPQFDAQAYASFKAELTAWASKLKELTQDTEEDFLELGANLQSFFDLSQSNDRQASKVVSSMEEGSGESGLGRIVEENSQGVGRLSQSYKSTLEQLKQLDLEVRPIFNFNETIRNIYRSLNNLGVAMKIETAKNPAWGGEVVIKALVDLAGQIKQDVDQIEDNASLTIEQLASLKDLVRTANGEIIMIRQAATTGLTAHIHKLADLGGRNLELCREILYHSQEMNQDLSSIVVALQFHDSCRQQLEHILHALDALRAEPSHEELQDQKKLYLHLGWIYKVLDLQVRLLDELSDKTKEESHGIEEHFTNIFSNTEQLVYLAEQVIRQDQDAKQCLNRLEKDLEDLAGKLTANHQGVEKEVGLIDQINEQLFALSQCVQRIDENRMNLKFLALNSEIKAYNSSDGGQVTGIISGEISKLSNFVQQEVENRSQMLNQLTESSMRFHVIFSDLLQGQQGLITSIKNLMNAGIDKVREDAAKVIELSQNSQSLELSMHRIQRHMDIKPLLLDPMVKIRHGLGNLMSQLLALAPGLEIFMSKENIDLAALESKYTMDSEREVHQNFIAQEMKYLNHATPQRHPQPSPAPVEEEERQEAQPLSQEDLDILEAEDQEETSEAEEKEKDELGENVELF